MIGISSHFLRDGNDDAWNARGFILVEAGPTFSDLGLGYTRYGIRHFEGYLATSGAAGLQETTSIIHFTTTCQSEHREHLQQDPASHQVKQLERIVHHGHTCRSSRTQFHCQPLDWQLRSTPCHLQLCTRVPGAFSADVEAEIQARPQR